MLQIKCQASEPIGSGEEDFFQCTSMVRAQDPWRRAILEPGTFIRTNLIKDHQAILHNIFHAPEEKYFKVYFILNTRLPAIGPFSTWKNFVEVVAMLQIKFQAS